MKWFVGILLASLIATAAEGGEYVWLEGEKPSSQNYPCGPAGVERPQFLSGERWLMASLEPAKVEKDCPKEGILIGYDFQAPSAGNYEIWNRIGMEFARSPFEWRIDQRAWQTISPQDLTCDLMEVGFWNEVAWIQMGRQEVAAGLHTLQIRLRPSYKEEQGKKVFDKILYCSDALCISKAPFRPNGKFKPDADWQTESDKNAAVQVFKIDPATSSPAERIETPLGGEWQACRFDEQEVVDRAGPTRTLPDMASAHWMLIAVPGNKFEVKPELRFCHRMVYRTRVDVPGALAGRSFVLRLPLQSLIASVHVNGRFCGWTKAPFAAWECDITRAVRPGQVNEVCVVVKDSYYAISEKKAGKSCRLLFNEPVAWMGAQNWVNQFFDFPIGTADYGGKSGILATPSLVVAGGVYAADVFVQPSVRKKQLAVELTLRNTSSEDRRVEIENEAHPVGAPSLIGYGTRVDKEKSPEGGTPTGRKMCQSQSVTIPAGGERVIQLAEPWENPRLWWPDDPALYQLVTTIKLGAHPIERAPDDVRLPRVGVERRAVQAQRRALAALGRLHVQ